MAEMLSPGVFVTEIDASTIVPTVSNSVGVFSGNFSKGPVDTYILITSVADLITFYGYPSNTNYNDWYQAYNFLQYGNKLLISRAANVGGTATQISGPVVDGSVAEGSTTITMTSVNGLSVGDLVTFGAEAVGEETVYEIVDINGFVITLDRDLEDDVADASIINSWVQSMNGIIEIAGETDVTATTFTIDGAGNTSTIDVPNDARDEVSDYVGDLMVIQNATDFESLNDTGSITIKPGSSLKFIARNPGAWSENVQICIAKPASFEANSTDLANHITRYAFEGIAVDDLFEYAPSAATGSKEFGVVIKSGDEIKEIYLVSLDETAKDYNNKSMYIETVINNSSSYVFVKDGGILPADTTMVYDFDTEDYINSPLEFVYALDSDIQADDLANAYDIFNNKEELDIDIVIGNELDNGISAKNLADTRQDCIAFLGCQEKDVVGKKSAIAVGNLVSWRKGLGTNPSAVNVNYNNMFVVACGNYKYQYDRYNDKYRWVGVQGDIAGLRAQTSMNRASWWASAGLERGQIKNVTKLAFNPTQGQRDMLYKNGINPIVAFPGQGTVMWGQKTLLDKPSSFDRVNVRGLFNTMERALSKMAKYQIMEFNDNFTRNRIVSMIKPYLSTVQAGRGIQDFLVICDESNNTADVISRNQLVVDIYIKPTYVAEFIQLRFTNAGTNSFAEVIGG